MDALRDEMLLLHDTAFERLTKRLDGMTDDEYFWEPVPNAWTLRRRQDGSFDGDWGVIFDQPAPFTTIAWRLGHIIEFLTADRCWQILAQRAVRSPLADGYPEGAASAGEMLAQAGAIWRNYVAAVDDAALRLPSGPAAGMWAEHSRMSFVLHIIDELIHHGAEIGVLRDLYRKEDPVLTAVLRGEASDEARAKYPDAVLIAAETGRWDAVRPLVDAGFSIEGRSHRTPLHHAAAAGRIDVIELLIERGADPAQKDPTYSADAVGWAEYFNKREAADFLRNLTGQKMATSDD
jgi:DinB superfamily/Ankyrin repeats (3 copies)